MSYKSKKAASCPCGDGDMHSLRTGGICDGIRSGKLDRALAFKLLETIRGKSTKGSFNEPAQLEPTGNETEAPANVS